MTREEFNKKYNYHTLQSHKFCKNNTPSCFWCKHNSDFCKKMRENGIWDDGIFPYDVCNLFEKEIE